MSPYPVKGATYQLRCNSSVTPDGALDQGQNGSNQSNSSFILNEEPTEFSLELYTAHEKVSQGDSRVSNPGNITGAGCV